MRNILTLAILLGLPTLAVAAPGDGLTGRLEIINLRAEPSTESAVIAKLRKGVQLYEYRRRNDWVEVGPTPADGAEGWIYGPLLVPQIPGNTAATIPGTTGGMRLAGKRMYVRPDAINLRAGPGTDAAVVAGLVRGQPLTVLERRDDWLEVDSDSARGWVYAPLLQDTPPTETADVTPSPDTAVEVTTTTDTDTGITLYVRPPAINLRDAPGTDTTVVDRLTQGQPVTLMIRGNGWLKVDTGTAQGWVYAPLLQDTPPTETAAVTASPDTAVEDSLATDSDTDTDTGITLYVRPPAINLRDAPGTDTTVVGRLTQGQPVTLMVRGNGWLKVDTGAAQGWVYAPLLQDTPPAETAAVTDSSDTAIEDPLTTDSNAGITLYVRPPAVNLRSSASTSAEVLGRLQQGQGLTVLAQLGDWVEVQSQETDMRHGWVYRPLLMSSIPTTSGSPTANRASTQLLLSGDDNREATRLLLAFLQQHGFNAQERRGLAVAVKFDTETFILEPRVTRDRLDRIIVAQLYSVNPSYRGASVVKGWVENLGGNLNIGQFTLSPDGGRLLFQGNITFVDRLDLLEITEYLDFLHQRLTRSILAVPGADIYLE